MDNLMTALKVGLSAWGYLVVTMAAIFGVLIVVKAIGKRK